MTVKNAYTISPQNIEPGDEFLFVVKAMVRHDGTFKVYRCLWHPFDEGVPQGNPIYNNTIESLFPSLIASGLKLALT